MKAEHAGAALPLVVLDTNGWISAALTKGGAPARVVRHVLGHGLPVFSPPTFAELESRLWMPKFDRFLSLELRRRILHDASAAAHWVDIPLKSSSTTYSRDRDDDMFIHTALAAKAPWLISGDRDLLDLPAIKGLVILSPKAALQLDEPPWGKDKS